VRAPDFDSGWRNVRSNTAFHTHELMPHGLPEQPFECKQYVRPSDGTLRGYVFEGRGDGQRIDVYGQYGGTVFGWSIADVIVMVPSAWSWTRGSTVSDGGCVAS
jgi:hypothetical protein